MIGNVKLIKWFHNGKEIKGKKGLFIFLSPLLYMSSIPSTFDKLYLSFHTILKLLYYNVDNSTMLAYKLLYIYLLKYFYLLFNFLILLKFNAGVTVMAYNVRGGVGGKLPPSFIQGQIHYLKSISWGWIFLILYGSCLQVSRGDLRPWLLLTLFLLSHVPSSLSTSDFPLTFLFLVPFSPLPFTGWLVYTESLGDVASCQVSNRNQR